MINPCATIILGPMIYDFFKFDFSLFCRHQEFSDYALLNSPTLNVMTDLCAVVVVHLILEYLIQLNSMI